MHAGGLRPPIAAQKVSQSKVEWGSVRNDSYAWLQDKTASNPEVLDYLEQVQQALLASLLGAVAFLTFDGLRAEDFRLPFSCLHPVLA